jgi:peptidoglycan/xylan/chitin deacetylase (PgdA/CDA1 family)
MARSLAARISRVMPPRPVILVYHRIATPDRDPWELSVTPAVFDRQLHTLARRRRVLPLREFVDRHVEGSLPADAAAITFDDGYACNSGVAAPLLEKHGLPATFFLATAMLGRTEEFWNDALERVVFDPNAVGRASIVAGEREIQVDLGEEPEPRWAQAWRAMSDRPCTMRQRAYMALWRALKPAPLEAQRRAIESIAHQIDSGLAPRSTHRPMTPEEAHRLSRTSGFDICGHTETHIALPLWDRATQTREIAQSRRICEEISGRPCTAFAYPYGDYSDLTLDCVRESGVTCAVSLNWGPVDALEPPLALSRIMMRNESAATGWTLKQAFLRSSLGSRMAVIPGFAGGKVRYADKGE